MFAFSQCSLLNLTRSLCCVFNRTIVSEEKIDSNPLKVELRKDVDIRLQAMTEEDRDRQSKIIVAKLLAQPKYKSSKRVALFLSLPNEVPTGTILKDLIARGDAAFIPQYSRGQMRMRRVLEGDLDIMVETSWKIKHHPKYAEREDAMENGGLDLVLAPGAALTREGWRCGHGGGYYDSYLANLIARHEADPEGFRRPYVIAIGFNQLIYPEIPVDKPNVQVDEVLTAE